MADKPTVKCRDCEEILSRFPDVDLNDLTLDLETWLIGAIKEEVRVALEELHTKAPWLRHD
jgi:hypothetical protein